MIRIRAAENFGVPEARGPILLKRSTAEWLLLLWGIDINRCPHCGE